MQGHWLAWPWPKAGPPLSQRKLLKDSYRSRAISSPPCYQTFAPDTNQTNHISWSFLLTWTQRFPYLFVGEGTFSPQWPKAIFVIQKLVQVDKIIPAVCIFMHLSVIIFSVNISVTIVSGFSDATQNFFWFHIYKILSHFLFITFRILSNILNDIKRQILVHLPSFFCHI